MFLCWLTLGTLSAPLDAEAQPAGKISRVGYLGSGLPSRFPHLLEAFPQGLRDVGYTEGRNIVIEYRWAKEQPARLPDLAAELVRLQVAVIVAADQEATRAARGVTTRIPIVTVGRHDSAWVALIANLIWPGRHVTGPSSAMPAWFGGKWVELLTETVPTQRLSQVPLSAVELPQDVEGEETCVEVDLRIVGLVERTRRPAISGWRVFVDAGGLMSCGQNLADPLRQAGRDAGKLLKGAKPADLAVEQSTDFELVIDLKTAKALGLTIPPSVLLRADEVIQ